MNEQRLSFIIVGASVAGLAAGIALKRSGHSVLILEKAAGLGDGRSTIPVGCARITPNGSKILYDWGLEERIEELQYQTSSSGFAVFRYEGNGEQQDLMGVQRYDEEMLSEARGQYLTFRHVDLINLLYDEFYRPTKSSSLDKNMVEVRFGAEAASIDLESCVVTLRSGEPLVADVIIGADGPSGMVRAALEQEGDREEISRTSDRLTSDDGDFWADSDSESEGSHVLGDTEGVPLVVYSATIPKSTMQGHPALADFSSYSHCAFFGSNRGAFVYSVGEDLSVCIYMSRLFLDGQPSGLKISDMLGSACDSAQVIRCIVSIADTVDDDKVQPPLCRPLQEHEPLQSWVSESGRVVVIGEAAHPFPAGAVYSYACALEDGSFIGKIFSHTQDRSRIPELLYAFQEHRKPRCTLLHDIEIQYVAALTLEGEMSVLRDAMFRANYQQGKNVLEMPESMEGQRMEETRAIFAYDAADDADEWWITWGRFRDLTVSQREEVYEKAAPERLRMRHKSSRDSNASSSDSHFGDLTPRPGQLGEARDDTHWLYDGSARREWTAQAEDPEVHS
ncbi:FAD-binding-3 domain-containing protein [Mycena indigotica]|uniref:FAD-binding-3 domain-containing protein n=1 Tax=Mycena indigotica TaxID=2126181 RepID=A0A8H6W0E6_9AGAR|nr:FAD-binding-3 domain-containing protein [Mycena indigotica]KAF7297003.1 FAD-binding-3 domain-containing protein [Mycena indigotica]